MNGTRESHSPSAPRTRLGRTIAAATNPHDIANTLAAFHDLLFTLSGSESLGALGGMLQSVVHRYTESNIDQIPPHALPAFSADFHEAHRAIADAIADGDADRATEACRDHLRYGHRGPSRELIDVFAQPAPQATRPR
jgi:DNA-binding FadR family transcriptional regulator